MNAQNLHIEPIQYDLHDIDLMARRARAEMLGEFFSATRVALHNLVRNIAKWNASRTAAARLMDLDDRMLADIGISRGNIHASTSGRLVKGAANRNDLDRNAA